MQSVKLCSNKILQFLTKSVPEMTYNVFSGTLNPTHSLTRQLSQVDMYIGRKMLICLCVNGVAIKRAKYDRD